MKVFVSFAMLMLVMTNVYAIGWELLLSHSARIRQYRELATTEVFYKLGLEEKSVAFNGSMMRLSEKFFSLEFTTEGIVNQKRTCFVSEGFVRFGNLQVHAERSDISHIIGKYSGTWYVKLRITHDLGNPVSARIITTQTEDDTYTKTIQDVRLYKLTDGVVDIDYRQIFSVGAYE